MGTGVGAPSARLGGQGLLAAAGLVAVVTLVSRAVGLARWAVFSHSVGATCVGQVYVTANAVPNVIFEIAAGGALAAIAVPLLARHLHHGDEELADRAASALLGWSLLVLLPLALVVALAAGPVAGALLGSSDLEQGCDPAAAQEAGRLMLVLFAPQVVLYGVGIVLTGVLQAHRRFLAAALAPLLSSLTVIAVYLAFGALHHPDQGLGSLSTSALVLLAGGTTLGVAALSLPLLVPTARLGVRWRPTLRFPAGSGRLAGALAVAGVLGIGAQQLFVVVMLLLTNSTGVGGPAVWTYAQTVYLLPYAVLVVPLATAAFPRLADAPARARATLAGALTGSVVAAVAGSALLLATRHDVGEIFLALDRGSDTGGRASLEALPLTLALLAPGLVGFAVLAVLTRALYAAHRPWDAAAGTMLGWAVAALLPMLTAPVILARDGTIGEMLATLAAASSLGMLLAGAVLLVRTRRVWGAAALEGVARAGASAAVGGLVVVLVLELLPHLVGPWPTGGWPAAVLSGVLTGIAVLVAVALALRWLAPRSFDQVRERLPGTGQDTVDSPVGGVR